MESFGNYLPASEEQRFIYILNEDVGCRIQFKVMFDLLPGRALETSNRIKGKHDYTPSNLYIYCVNTNASTLIS